ncbi:OLC1v1002666C1 [Oldenlandia corymbosa var. corymbosa]|uniref:Glycosyltransferase n=1 Tax=Oldenlandia corymbosa var. corymbosa TaxID=529605 RepID=A0AAV1D8Z1_OLDCO|nr:OLC1v1002666C1 [Oldenlandia corymbosa var. corymbosa]
MGSVGANDQKPHAVCIPYPAQGHINPMLKLAKILHHRGFYITFVNTEYNHKRLLKSRGPNSLDGFPDFKFETIPDGLPPSDADSTQDIPSLCESTTKTCIVPFSALLSKLQDSVPEIPPVSCIVSDGVMSFTLEAAEQFGLPEVLFWTTSACGLLGYTQYSPLIEKGYTPLKDVSQVTDGYLETKIEWIPGMKPDIRLRDLPSFIRTTSPDDIMLNFLVQEVSRIPKARALILNTFEALEQSSVDALSAMYPLVYSIGPLPLLLNQIQDDKLKSINSNLWKEEPECIDWLNSKEPNSVVYVNFGSITVMSAQQLTEFAWGLANSKKPFLWIIRPDIVAGDTAMVPPEFLEETKERSMLASWCPQEQVLNHPAIGGFLTHSGWNSTLESICGGVPVICWPFFAEQQTNCRYSCVEWEMGMEIDNDVKRDEVEVLVRELMDGEKGQKMREKALEWKSKAEAAVKAPDGSSRRNLEKLLKEMVPHYSF